MATKTVGEIIEWLKKFNPENPIYAYSGEITGIVVVIAGDTDSFRGVAMLTDEPPGVVRIEKQEK